MTSQSRWNGSGGAFPAFFQVRGVRSEKCDSAEKWGRISRIFSLQHAVRMKNILETVHHFYNLYLGGGAFPAFCSFCQKKNAF